MMLLKVSMIIGVFPIQRGFLAPTLSHKYAFTTLALCYTPAEPVKLGGRGIPHPPPNFGKLMMLLKVSMIIGVFPIQRGFFGSDSLS